MNQYQSISINEYQSQLIKQFINQSKSINEYQSISIIFLKKSIHIALHTEVNFKCHFYDSAKSVAPQDT